MVKALLSEHPALGWVSSLTSITAVLPAWVFDIRDMLGIISVMIGLAVGLLTFRLQLATVRERARQIGELDRMRERSRHESPPPDS